jgi:hypothetical protein
VLTARRSGKPGPTHDPWCMRPVDIDVDIDIDIDVDIDVETTN